MVEPGSKIRDVYYESTGYVVGPVMDARGPLHKDGSILYAVEFDGRRSLMFDTEFTVIDAPKQEEVSK